MTKPRVYFDGLCQLCSREIDHYKKQKGSETLEFIDITSPKFNAKIEGLDPFLVHKVMHVKRSDGTLATEVDAFIEIWKHLPKYNWAASLAQKPWVRPVLDIGYIGFAKVRPYLPRKKALCEDSPYCET